MAPLRVCKRITAFLVGEHSICSTCKLTLKSIPHVNAYSYVTTVGEHCVLPPICTRTETIFTVGRYVCNGQSGMPVPTNQTQINTICQHSNALINCRVRRFLMSKHRSCFGFLLDERPPGRRPSKIVNCKFDRMTVWCEK